MLKSEMDREREGEIFSCHNGYRSRNFTLRDFICCAHFPDTSLIQSKSHMPLGEGSETCLPSIPKLRSAAVKTGL